MHHEQNHLTVTAEGACQNVAFSWYFVAFFCLFVFCFTPARSARGLPTGLQVALHMQSLPTWVRNSAEICRWFRAVFYLTSICLTCRHPVNFLWHVLDQNCQSYLWNSHWFTQKRPRFLKLEFLKLECIATTTVTIYIYGVFIMSLIIPLSPGDFTVLWKNTIIPTIYVGLEEHTWGKVRYLWACGRWVIRQEGEC